MGFFGGFFLRGAGSVVCSFGAFLLLVLVVWFFGLVCLGFLFGLFGSFFDFFGSSFGFFVRLGFFFVCFNFFYLVH